MFLGACVFHTKPSGNQAFDEISQLSELAGVYANRGNPSGFLSQVIWGNAPPWQDAAIGHENIELIEVIPDNDAITVKAIDHGCTVYQKSYAAGRDFELSDGKIIIHREFYLLSRGAGDVLAGPSYEQVTLGIDTQKQGKSKSSEYAAGLIFMLLPLAAADIHEIKYEKVSDKPVGFESCTKR